MQEKNTLRELLTSSRDRKQPSLDLSLTLQAHSVPLLHTPQAAFSSVPSTVPSFPWRPDQFKHQEMINIRDSQREWGFKFVSLRALVYSPQAVCIAQLLRSCFSCT